MNHADNIIREKLCRFCQQYFMDQFGCVVADDVGTLHCVDIKTGKVLWTHNYGIVGKGSPVYADGKIYVADVHGGWHILSVNRRGAKLLLEQMK